jgi:hypothetical protein
LSILSRKILQSAFASGTSKPQLGGLKYLLYIILIFTPPPSHIYHPINHFPK